MKKWNAPEILTVDLAATANSNQPDQPSDDYYFDFYTVCNTCS